MIELLTKIKTNNNKKKKQRKERKARFIALEIFSFHDAPLFTYEWHCIIHRSYPFINIYLESINVYLYMCLNLCNTFFSLYYYFSLRSINTNELLFCYVHFLES